MESGGNERIKKKTGSRGGGMTRACRCREAKFPAGVMCSGSRSSSAPRRLAAGRGAARPAGAARRGLRPPRPAPAGAAAAGNSHLANSAAQPVPPQPVFLAPFVTLSALGTRCAPPLGSPVPFPAAPDLPPSQADFKAG